MFNLISRAIKIAEGVWICCLLYDRHVLRQRKKRASKKFGSPGDLALGDLLLSIANNINEDKKRLEEENRILKDERNTLIQELDNVNLNK